MRSKFSMALCALTLLSASPAAASLITFDDLDPCLARPGCPDPGDPIFDGYQGLNWSMHAMNATAVLVPPTARNVNSGLSILATSGYRSAMVSGPNVAYPNNCCDEDSFGSFSSASLFTLSSLYLGAAWRDNLNVEILGYANGGLIHSYTAVVGVAGPTFFSFDWSGLDTVVFHSFGGTFPGPLAPDGTHFVLDDVSLEPSPVPLPGSLLLFGSGLVVLGGWATRRSLL
jgi:hypothetical protein